MSDEIETIDKNPKSWAAWKREAERLQAIIDDMALAAMDSEPVAYMVRRHDEHEGTGTLIHAEYLQRYQDRGDYHYTPLYRHAQQLVVPDEMLCEFYEVDNWPDLVREVVKHVEQLQDSAKRNVKPWEDTFPETLLPAYIERVEQADKACRAAMLQAGNPAAWWQGLYGEIKGRGQRSTRDFTPDLGMSTEDIIDAINKRHVSDAGNSPGITGAEQRIADAVELLKQAAPAMLADNHGPNGPLVGRLKSPVIPDGYVMVPVKPTMEILDEFDSIIDYGAEDSEVAWRRLLAAAPQEGK